MWRNPEAKAAEDIRYAALEMNRIAGEGTVETLEGRAENVFYIRFPGQKYVNSVPVFKVTVTKAKQVSKDPKGKWES